METFEVCEVRRVNEIFAGGLYGKGLNSKNIINVEVHSGSENIVMSLNAGGLIEAFKQGIVKSFTPLGEDDVKALLSQLERLCLHAKTANQVLVDANLICKAMPDKFREDVFAAMATAMENSGVKKIVASDLGEVEAKAMCGSDFVLVRTEAEWLLIKRRVENPSLLDMDEKQLERLSAAAEQGPEMAMALELLSADCSEEEECLWRGKSFDDTFCTIIAKFYPVFAKFVDLGINWTEAE